MNCSCQTSRRLPRRCDSLPVCGSLTDTHTPVDSTWPVHFIIFSSANDSLRAPVGRHHFVRPTVLSTFVPLEFHAGRPSEATKVTIRGASESVITFAAVFGPASHAGSQTVESRGDKCEGASRSSPIASRQSVFRLSFRYRLARRNPLAPLCVAAATPETSQKASDNSTKRGVAGVGKLIEAHV